MVEINKIDFNETNNQARPVVDQPIVNSLKPAKKKKPLPQWLKILLIFIGTVVGLLIIQTAIFAPIVLPKVKKTSLSAQAAVAAIKNQDLVTANQQLVVAQDSLTSLKKSYQLGLVYRFFPGIRPYYLDGQAGLEAADQAVQAGIILTQAIEPHAEVLGLKGKGSFTGGTTEDRIAKIVETIGEITPQTEKAIEQLSLASISIGRINPGRYPQRLAGNEIRSQIINLKQNLQNASDVLKKVQPGLEVLPNLLGAQEPRTYLVLFQNDTERRATGGFMTAYATLKVDKGKITAEKSEDMYSLDAKFRSRLEPPRPIAEYFTNIPYWYLRDMNLSPDFKESMDVFRSYYDEIEDEPKVDGVIAVDTNVLTDLISILGGVEVPGYGMFTSEIDERCDCPNVIYQLELIVGEPLPFMKEDRKGVLGPLMQQIMFKTMEAESDTWGPLFGSLWQSLEQKNVLLYFDNSEEQLAAEKMGFAGRIQNTEGDYLFLVDSNFGGAKSDLYIDQTVTQDIQVQSDGTVEKTVTVEYINPEEPDNCNLERKSGLCLNGLYRDWVRLYVPKGSQLIEILGSEVEPMSYEESGKTVFEAFYGDESPLRPLGKKKLVFRYQLPDKAAKEYQLYIQKQPGIKPFEYIVNYGNQTEKLKLEKDVKLTF